MHERSVDHRGEGRIRVATVITRFIAGAGGIALRGLLALDPERYAVTVFSGEGGRFVDQARAGGVEYVPLDWMKPDISLEDDRRCLHELTRLLADGCFDLVHTQSAKAGVIGRIAARRAGVDAIVHTFHGFPFHSFQSRPRRAAYIGIERRLGRFTRAFMAAGTVVAADAIRLRIAPPERVMTIPSPIEPDIAPVTQDARRIARELIGVPPGVKLVGSVGRLDYQKAPEILVRAVASMDRPDVHCVWIGGGPQRELAEQAVRRHGVQDRFSLLGERSDVAKLLPGLDIFAMSSRYEGLPCAVVEAMTCGIPTVATAVNSVPDIVIPGRTGLLVPPEDPVALGRAIAFFLDHPDRAARAAEAARTHLGNDHSPGAMGRQLDETYQLVLADRRTGEGSPRHRGGASDDGVRSLARSGRGRSHGAGGGRSAQPGDVLATNAPTPSSR